MPEFVEFEDAVASWVQDAGGVEPMNIWITPKAAISVKLPTKRPPRVLVGRLMKDANTGLYFFKPLNWPFLMKARELPRRLGLPFSERVIARLVYAGFVKGCRVTMHVHLVDVESLWEHLQNTSGPDGEGFWTPERRALYAEAVSVIRRGSDKRRDRPTKEEREKN